MKPSILALAASIIASALFACAQPPSPTPRLFGAASTTPACDALHQPGVNFSGSDFVGKKVSFLSASYQPKLGMAPTASDIGNAVDPNSQYGKDIAAAFDMAPDLFKNSLCGLTQVFIVQCAQSSCTPQDAIKNSWGLRVWPRGTGEYIATSAALWQNGNPALPFHQYRRERLKLILSTISQIDLSSWANLPTYSPAMPNDTGAMTVLAALAHEMGHVLWYDSFVPVRGQGISLNNFCGGFYKQNSWNYIDVPPGRWISFGQQNANILHNPDYISIIKGDIQSQFARLGHDFSESGEHLHVLLQDTGLASTLAAVSPDEEFVETYQLYVLLRSSLNGVPQFTNFPLTIYGRASQYIHNTPIDYKNKPSLLSKLNCFGQLP